MHIFTIREAKSLEDKPLKKFLQSMKKNANRKIKKRPLLSSQKKLLDERFNAMSERIKLFSSVHEDFKGRHTRFLSSSSEDEGSDEDKCKDTTELKANRDLTKSLEKSDRISSCPYPSVTEEMERLGLKKEWVTPSFANGLKTKTGSIQTTRKKKKSENTKCSLSAPSKTRQKGKKKKSAVANCSVLAPSKMSRKGKKRKAENALHGCSTLKKKPKNDDLEEDALPIYNGILVNDHDIVTEDELLLDASSMRMFIGTWKETCRDLDASKVWIYFYCLCTSLCGKNIAFP